MATIYNPEFETPELRMTTQPNSQEDNRSLINAYDDLYRSIQDITVMGDLLSEIDPDDGVISLRAKTFPHVGNMLLNQADRMKALLSEMDEIRHRERETKS